MSESATGPQASFEFVPPVDRAACIRHTHNEFDALLWEPLAGLETRYLAEEYVVPPEASSMYFQLASVREAMFDPALTEDEVVQLGSEEILAELNGKAEHAGAVWATDMLERAAQEGLVHVQEGVFAPDEETNWKITPTAEGVPVLAIFTGSGPEDQPQVVNLDELYVRDPAFVKEQIRLFHRTKLFARLGNKIRSGAKYHEIPASYILPDFILQIAALPPEERAVAQNEILQLMTYFAQIDESISDRVYRARADWSKQQVHDTLQHMEECPTQPDDIREGAASMRQFYRQMDDIVTKGQPLGPLTQDQKGYMHFAYLYFPNHVSFVEEDAKASAATAQAVAKLVEESQGTPNPAQFLIQLRIKLPHVYQMYSDLNNCIGGFWPDSLKRAIEDTVQRVHLFQRHITPEGLIEQLEQEITMLGLTYLSRGVGRLGDADRGPVKVTDHVFRSALLQLVCKDARSKLATETESASSEADRRRAQTLSSAYEEIEKKLVGEYQERARQHLAKSAAFAERAQKADVIRRSLGLSDEDIAWLSQIPNPKEITSVDKPLFNTVFHTLLAERHGIIRDRTSPVVLSFIHEFLEDHGVLHHDRQQKLQELGLL